MYKNDVNKVSNIARIANFAKFVDSIFKNKITKDTGIIYLLEYNSKILKKLPSNIYNYYIHNKDNYNDGDIAYLSSKTNNRTVCLVFYGRNKYHTITQELGALISSKVKNINWKVVDKNNIKNIKEFYLGWGLAQYKFSNINNYKSIILDSYNHKVICNFLVAIFYGKELINIPSSSMGPDALEDTFINFGDYHNAKVKIIKEIDIKNKFPLIYAVGKGSIEKPRLLELNWGNKKYPLITLVGKGVCFDTGGLDLKPSQFMRNMKKDMGGAASILSLTHLIIANKLKVNLKVLIPTVNNDIGPSSMRPGDVFNSKKGITVEIGNTDAEGRLILADTLSYADTFKPKLLIDFATLTGAARVALGPDLPAFFTNSESIAKKLDSICILEKDPMWRLPLYTPYEKWLNSDVADTNNISAGSFAGSVVAALFLNKFINFKTNWIHVDTYAWNDKSIPGKSKGGHIMGIKSIYKLIQYHINNLY